MVKRILLRIQNRFLKGIVIRYLVEAGYEITEVWDNDDLRFKLDVYRYAFILYILEITEENPSLAFSDASHLKREELFKEIPVLALIPKDTSDFVMPSLKSGIEDLLLLPRGKEHYRATIMDKLSMIFRKIDPQPVVNENEILNPSEEINSEDVLKKLETDLKHAARGKYPLSLLMIRFTGIEDEKTDSFMEKLQAMLRDTDSILQFSSDTWIISCPFTEKSFIIEVERKVLAAFESEIGKQGNHKRINLFTATYPYDEDDLPKLLERMENGILNSMVIDSITAPLKSLSRTELEAYKQKIRQYRRFNRPF